MALRGKLERRLEKIEHRIIKMTSLVQDSIVLTMEAINENDDSKAVQVIELDKSVDDLELDIEKRCVALIGLQQPIAGDLREVTSALKIITDLERIGDYSSDIAKIQIQLEERISNNLKYIEPMVEIIQEMLNLALKSFIEKNVDIAHEAAKMDDKVDNIYSDAYYILINKIITEEQNENELVNLLFIGRYLERMADHITNICERIVYMVDGIRIYY